MNYQQAIADATKQIRCRTADAATTDAGTGSGSFSCSSAAADAATILHCLTTADAAVITTTDAAAGSGFFSFCAAAATAADADAANVLIPEGSHMRTLSHCNNE